MRALLLPCAIALLLAACGGDVDAGCDEGRLLACACDDGSTGTRGCGEASCHCEPRVCALRHADEVDAGAVPPGVRGAAALALENVGTGSCEISNLRLEGCGDAFAVDPALASFAVEPGAGSIPIEFLPSNFEPRVCTLAFDVTDPEAPRRRVQLTGRGDSSCLAIEPRSLAFDLEVAACGTAEGEITVTNGCGTPLQLESLALAEDGPFLLLAEPPLPRTLAPGAGVAVVVGYRPVRAGAHDGRLAVGVAGLPPQPIALAGEAGEGIWASDHHATAPRPQLDLLVVIDNGTSMVEETANLQRNLGPYLTALANSGLDLHVAVTTSGLVAGGDCPGGVGGGEDGRFFPVVGETPRVITGASPDDVAAWQANIDVGACRDGPNHLLEAAVRALTEPLASSSNDPRHPEPADGNAGFLRPDAFLLVMAISDRDDASPESVNHYFNALLSLKGYDYRRFNFLAITGDRGTGCEREGLGLATAGDRLIELAEKTWGGWGHSICRGSWDLVDEVRMDGAPREACFRLTEPPADLDGDGEILEADGEIELTLDGVVRSSFGPQGQRIWWYEGAQNSLCFNEFDPPPLGSTLDIRYRLACLRTEPG